MKMLRALRAGPAALAAPALRHRRHRRPTTTAWTPAGCAARAGRTPAPSISTTTIVEADGKLRARETGRPTRTRPSTVSTSIRRSRPTRRRNSDMKADPAELNVVRQQFARFGSRVPPLSRRCIGRSRSPGSRRDRAAAAAARARRGPQYDDVRDAWSYYLEHDNQGRGVVLVGHSQGRSSSPS